MFNAFPTLTWTPLGIFELITVLIVQLCTAAILLAVIRNFLQTRRAPGTVTRERRSVVATASMLLFFVGCFLLLKFRIGVLTVEALPVRIPLIVLGLALLVTGCVVNLLGRRHLGRNWANQATIYAEHTLVTRGVFGLVRHPLYASLIWMFIGASLIYLNAAAFLATLLIFLPAMTYRATIEERLLAQQFPEYPAYQRRVGMFFPKCGGGRHDSV